jgi:hypothetical protein
VPLDLTLLNLYRLNGQELTSLPGLMTFAPPRKAARGRDHEPLLILLHLNGNTPFSTAEYLKLTSEAAAAFYNTHGALTTALRLAAESVNRALLERNLSTSGRGQYVIGLLTLAALRGTQLTLLQCGPTHVLTHRAGETRHLHDPALSGKGLGLSQTISQYFSQIELQPGDRLLLCPKLPPAWDNVLASDRGLPALDSTRKRLLALIDGDVSAVLIQVTEGNGSLNLPRETPPPSPPKAVEASPAVNSAPAFIPLEPAHVVGRPPEDQPSAYAIPPQSALNDEALIEQLTADVMPREFPPSIPRARPPALDMEPIPEEAGEEPAPRRSPEEITARRAQGKRQAARFAINGIQTWRRVTEKVGAGLRKFMPRLLPDGESTPSLPMSGVTLTFIAIVVPVLVVTVAFMFYMRFGRSAQYETFIAQAQAMRVQAMKETDPARQRVAWTNVLQRVAQAESFGETSETIAVRQEAQARLDALLGVSRLAFSPAFSAGVGAEISRMAASESDLYMLDAAQGRILRAALTGRGFELDTVFDCAPGEHGGSTVGPLVDLLILPKSNMLNSSVLGVDAAGNLLYCSPGQLPRALPLTPPDTNWGRVIAMTLDGNQLYVLDAPSRAVWIYNGEQDAENTSGTEGTSTFPDSPYFFFGIQIPEIQDAIDIAVSSDELYLLHADGRLTHCTYSRQEEVVPTRCDSPVTLVNPFPAYGGTDVFAQAHFTQMTLTGLPDLSLLLLDADGQTAFRLSIRAFELQAILGAVTGSLPGGRLGAMTAGPNHVLYLAHGDQVYISNDAP